MKWQLLALFLWVPWLMAMGQTNISGIWVSKPGNRMWEVEIGLELKVEDGKVSGIVCLPSQDMPIVSGKVGGNNIEFVMSADYFGQERLVSVKGNLTAEGIFLTMPGLWGMESLSGWGRNWGAPWGLEENRFAGRPPGERPFPPGANPPPQGGFRIARPEGFLRDVFVQRGTVSQLQRKPIDYKSLPKISLPPLKDLPDNGLAQTPPMGWTTKHRNRSRIDDKMIREIADVLVANGMRDAGYTYINIDDGWQGERDAQGVLQGNARFPDIKGLAEYVHAKGLKLGLYSTPAPQSYRGFAGSYGHEELDATVWAAWGIDFLKYEWCSARRVFTNADEMRRAYQKMAEALRATDRPIVYDICQYGRENVWQWGAKAGGNLWRTTIDINDYWYAMGRIGFSQTPLSEFAGPGHWNDLDMLEIGNGGLNDTECRAQMSLWSILAAPLIASNDPRRMYNSTREILLNREVIAVNQDKLGQQGKRLLRDGDKEIWTRALDNGDIAVGLFNRGEIDTEISVRWADLQLTPPLRVRDLWKHSDRPYEATSFTAKVPSHGVVMLRVATLPKA